MLRSNADDHLLYDPSWADTPSGSDAEIEVAGEAGSSGDDVAAPNALAASRERSAARRRPPGTDKPAEEPTKFDAKISASAAPTTPAQVANDVASDVALDSRSDRHPNRSEDRPHDVSAAPGHPGNPADTADPATSWTLSRSPIPAHPSTPGDVADPRSAAMPDVTPPDPDARRDPNADPDNGLSADQSTDRSSNRSADDGIEWPEPVIGRDEGDETPEASVETDDPNFDDDELADYDEEAADAEAARDEELGVPVVEREDPVDPTDTADDAADEVVADAADDEVADEVADEAPAKPAPVAKAPAATEPPEEDVMPATPPKITSVTEVRNESDAATWNRPPAAEIASVPSRGEMARSLTWHVCPFCGHKNESAHQPCESCGMVDSSEARTATVRRGGPWFVRLPGNPGGPGMKFTVLQEMVRSGEIRSGTVVRGPSTQQLWTFAARVRGLSHMFGLCWNCNRRLQEPEAGEEADDFCIYCGALLDAPSNPDQQLEAVRPSSPSRVSGGADLSPAGQKRLTSMPHDGGGIRDSAGQPMLPAPEPLALNDDPEGKGLLTTQELERVFNVGSRRGEVIGVGPEAFAGKPRPTGLEDDDDTNSTVGRIILGIAALAVIVVLALYLLDII